MPSVLQIVVRFAADLLGRLGFVTAAGPLLIDRGRGLLYDVERDITWLQDANYAKTIGQSPDGQMTWYKAMAWVKSLNYRGIVGWRLPGALNSDGSGPCLGENCDDSEIGHLFLVAAKRKSPPDLSLQNFSSIHTYWFSTEASETEAFAFRMSPIKQGPLAKDPWGGELPVPMVGKVLPWPVHDGDVGAGLFTRLVRAALDFFRFSRRGA